MSTNQLAIDPHLGSFSTQIPEVYSSLLQTILLHDANSVGRGLPGCLSQTPCNSPIIPDLIPKRHRKWSPRLVGIELNPGPTPLQEMVAAIGSAAGSALAKTVKKKKKKISTPTLQLAETVKVSKPSQRQSRRRLTSSSSSIEGSNMYSRLTGLTRVAQPISGGNIYGNKIGRMNPIISVPFNTISQSTLSTLSTSTPSVGFSVTGSTLISSFDLNPYTNNQANDQASAFGVGIANLTKCFSRWRIRKLVVTYIPCVNTSTNGNVVFGASGENYLTGTPTFQQVSDCERMVACPVWQTATVDITSVARNGDEWLYTYVQGSTVAEQRQNYCCSLLIATFGTPAPSGTKINYGQFRFDGIIEFTDMADVIGGITAHTESKESEPNPSDRAITEELLLNKTKLQDQREFSGSEDEAYFVGPSSSSMGHQGIRYKIPPR